MRQIVLTKSPAILLRSSLCTGAGRREIELRPLTSLVSDLKGLEAGSLVYVDVRGLQKPEHSRLLKQIGAQTRVFVGIIDLGGSVDDPASLFHAGAVDYIGKGPKGPLLTPRRRKSVLAFAMAGHEREAVLDAPPTALSAPASAPLAADRWAGVVSGADNRFAFLFVEVDDAEELKKRHEPDNLASAMETFKSYVEDIATAHGGRLWMWSRFGGIVLFPLDDSPCPAAVCGLRIFLSRIFYDVEESPLPGQLSFRLALSIGSTYYDPGDTGRIVSDAINSIFHLGRRYLGPGQFMLTAEACESAPSSLRVLLQPAGTFEGRKIMRMQIPAPREGGAEANGA